MTLDSSTRTTCYDNSTMSTSKFGIFNKNLKTLETNWHIQPRFTKSFVAFSMCTRHVYSLWLLYQKISRCGTTFLGVFLSRMVCAKLQCALSDTSHLKNGECLSLWNAFVSFSGKFESLWQPEEVARFDPKRANVSTARTQYHMVFFFNLRERKPNVAFNQDCILTCLTKVSCVRVTNCVS